MPLVAGPLLFSFLGLCIVENPLVRSTYDFGSFLISFSHLVLFIWLSILHNHLSDKFRMEGTFFEGLSILNTEAIVSFITGGNGVAGRCAFGWFWVSEQRMSPLGPHFLISKMGGLSALKSHNSQQTRTPSF